MLELAWSDLSSDPNALAVVAWKGKRLVAAHGTPIASGAEYLTSMAFGRRILDSDVVEHDASNEQSDRWLLRHLGDVADSCGGVDVLPDVVAQLRERGYDLHLHDVTASPAGGRSAP